MIFSLSNDGNEWCLEFGGDSVTLTVEDLVPGMTTVFWKFVLATGSLLLSQWQDFKNNYLARVLVAPNQQGTHEVRHQVLSSVDAEYMDTCEYQLSNLGDVVFYWKKDQLHVDAVFRPGFDTPFSPTACGDLEMGESADNTNLLDEEEYQEKSLEQHQSLKDQRQPLPYWGVVHLEQE